jgi:eukaryotic-like serine/threonine-protein kinase
VEFCAGVAPPLSEQLIWIMVEKKRSVLIEELFHSALALDPGQRKAFLDRSCGSDLDLRAEVQNLISMHEKPGNFLDLPAYEGGTDLLADVPAPSLTGKLLAHYEILESIGAGGMGEIYRARDTHLDRSVAIKVLPAEAVADPERKRRFVQEAKSASALNHPGIVTIHDINRSDGIDFIAMEYIVGKTLNRLIRRKGLPINEVLKYGVQIADALAAAHAAGIVHRDLKPANIMVTEKGLVKVLDFGLAKLTESSPVDKSGTTQTLDPVTEEGTIIGTVAYMSPEQAEGKKVDARSDIFSFGSLLYEMITGRRAFQGDSKVSTLSAILSKEPAALNDDIPYDLEKIVTRCLRKDPERRFQTAADLKVALEELKEDSESGKLAPALPTPRHVHPWILLAVAALLVLLAGAAGWYFFSGPGRENSFAVASFTQLTNQPGEEYSPSLSPDGRFFVYASRAAGNWDIYSQRVGGQNPVKLTRDCPEDDTQPSFSPDGDFIAFRSERGGGGIFVMGATGESSKRLTDFGYNPSWSPNGKEIAFASHGFETPDSRAHLSELWTVTVASGEIRKLNISLGDAVQPSWSPHGDRIAFWSIRAKDTNISGQRDIWTIPVAGGEPMRVTNDPAVDWNPVWSPDGRYLYFSSDRAGSMNLWRVPIEENSGKVLGQPESVTTGGGTVSHQHLSISRDGRRMVFVERIARTNLQKVAFDSVTETAMSPPVWITQGSRLANTPDPSPDGQSIVFTSLGSAQEDLFLIRSDGSGERQITNDSARDRGPRWSPDGKRIMFFSNRGADRYQVWAINPDGSGLQKLGETDQPINMSVWSPDGARIAYYTGGHLGNFISELERPWKDHTESLPTFSGSELFGVTSWSPDGKWLGGHLVRKDSGTNHPTGVAVYSLVTKQFDKLTDFGWSPVWLADSRRLLFPYQDKIYLVNRDHKRIRDIFSVRPYTISFHSLRLSKDNRMIYYALEMNEADIWLMTLK